MKARHMREASTQPNDATLVQKVESEVFRDPAIQRGRSTSTPKTASPTWGKRIHPRSSPCSRRRRVRSRASEA